MQSTNILEAFRRQDIDLLRRNLDPSGVYSDLRTEVFLNYISEYFEDLMSEYEGMIDDTFKYYRFSSCRGLKTNECAYAFINLENYCFILLKLTMEGDVVVDIQTMDSKELNGLRISNKKSTPISVEFIYSLKIYEEDKVHFDAASLSYLLLARETAVTEISNQSKIAPIDTAFIKCWYDRSNSLILLEDEYDDNMTYRINEKFDEYITLAETVLKWHSNHLTYKLFAKFYKSLDTQNEAEVEIWKSLLQKAIDKPFYMIFARDNLNDLRDTITYLDLKVNVEEYKDVFYTQDKYYN